MSLRLPCWIHYVMMSLAVLSLGGCGGLPGGERTQSTGRKFNKRTVLASAVEPRLAAHLDQSGFHPLVGGREALAARLVLADAAQESLDVQYFIWNKDLAGKVFFERLLRAADRGVHVRLLLDDLGTMPSDDLLLAIDSHPQIEVRMFNPVTLRSPRILGMAAEFGRINRRMHNKSFTADGQIAIVGGRNIGDEYFGASEDMNFADLDVAVIGPVVREVSDAFDLYWNHKAAVPITALSWKNAKPEKLAKMRAALVSHPSSAEANEYAESVRNCEFARQLRNRAITYSWGRGAVVADHPDKVITAAADTDTHLAPKLRAAFDATKKELFLVSPYFIPGKQGVELLTSVRQRGVRVVVVTNSLSSTDGVPVHSKYQLYRKQLLQAGIEIYEMKATPTPQQQRRLGIAPDPDETSSAALHAKTFAFDRRVSFIGSYNLDPRSSKLNTEMGVLIDCPELAKDLPGNIERSLIRSAYRLELVGNRIEWVSTQGGKQIRHTSEPDTDLMKRLKVGVLRWLPIEEQL